MCLKVVIVAADGGRYPQSCILRARKRPTGRSRMTERTNKRQRSESYGERSNQPGTVPSNPVKLYVQSTLLTITIHPYCAIQTRQSRETVRLFQTRHIALHSAISLPPIKTILVLNGKYIVYHINHNHHCPTKPFARRVYFQKRSKRSSFAESKSLFEHTLRTLLSRLVP